MTRKNVSENSANYVQQAESYSVWAQLPNQMFFAGIIALSFVTGMLINKHTRLPQQVMHTTSYGVSSLTSNTSEMFRNFANTAEDMLKHPQPHMPAKLNVNVKESTAASVPFISSARAEETRLNSTDYYDDESDSPFESFSSRFKTRNQTPVVTLQEINSFLRYRHSEYSYIDNKYFIQNAQSKLPGYEKTFRQASQQYRLDWRLVAAIAYQESVWDPNAVSPTGVEGMMMLTQATAEEMGVEDRTDSTESIYGGAGYFRKLLSRLPLDITGPDRFLMALASYNMGYGHLEAAREITEQQGADSTLWAEVKKRLPLLQKERYYRNSRYGYAKNALQAIHYVSEVQKHYDMLLMLTEQSRIKAGNISKEAKAGFALARYES